MVLCLKLCINSHCIHQCYDVVSQHTLICLTTLAVSLHISIGYICRCTDVKVSQCGVIVSESLSKNKLRTCTCLPRMVSTFH